MIQASFTVSPTSGDVYATKFTFVDNTTASETVQKTVWSFGDGTDLVYNNTQPTHIFNYPGNYTVGLTATDKIGTISTTTQTINVDYVYRDYVLFTQIPEEYSNPGTKTLTPFKVQVVTTQLDKPILLDLFCTNSNSIPYEHVPARWSFLNPTWKFTDVNDTVITVLSVEGIPVYKDGYQVALSGEAEFYFIDSTSTGNPQENCPLLITCTLQTSSFNYPLESNIYPYASYANNKNVRAATVWYVNDLQPDFLKVTSNYIDEMRARYWEDVKIPFLITAHSDRSYKLPGANSSTSDIIFTYPPDNTTGLISEVSAVIPQLPLSSYTIDESPLYFQRYDENNFRVGGYIFTTLTAQTTSSSSTIQASAVIHPNQTYTSNIFPYVGGIAPNPFVIVSNPEQNTLNKITLVPYPINCTDINYFKTQKILVDGTVKEIQTPILSTTSTFNYTMSGFSGIYGIAIDPRNYDILACDAELDCIYKFSSTGSLLSTLQLSTIGGYDSVSAAYTPSCISIDSDYNFWVTLFNDVSVLKFDKDFNLTYTVQPTGVDTNYIFDGDFTVKPPTVETDRANNCWVTYAHPLCSLLVKYGSNGNVLSQINLDNYSVPVDLAVDINNNVWVANTYNVLSADGSIQLYNSTTGSLITSITGIPRPGYLALDKNNNLWFTHSINGLGYYNTNTSQLSVWQIADNTINFVDQISSFRINETYLNDENISGLGIDVFNRVWVINSYNNTANIILSATPQFTNDDVRVIAIRPNSILGYYLDLNTGDTYTESLSTYSYKSAQAVGDWTGNKWYQKYLTIAQLSAKTVTGESTPFSIYPFINEYQIRKVNESFNTAEYFKSLALPEILQNNTILWDSFFPATVGNANLSANEDMGQVTYERIANFLQNHADVDTCGIDQLLSLAQETLIPAADYSTELPAEIKRMLDIASVSRTKLWGIPDLTPNIKSSLGQELNPFTYTLTADTKIILRSKLDNTYTLYTVPMLGDQTVYPLSSLQGYGFAQPVTTNYLFYEFKPSYSGKYVENIIDWNSTFTTLNSTISTFEQWYGEEGVLETAFNYLLTKNLFLK